MCVFSGVVCTHFQVVNETSARTKRNDIPNHHVTTSKEELRFIHEGKKKKMLILSFTNVWSTLDLTPISNFLMYSVEEQCVNIIPR